MGKLFFVTAGIFTIAIPFFAVPAVAHVGEQRIVEGRYVVQLSRSPLTPRSGETASFLVSFLDIENDAIITKPLLVDVRLAHLEQLGSSPRFIDEKRGLETSGGSVDYAYTFPAAGFYEVYVNFAFADRPEKIYSAEDFLFEVPVQRDDKWHAFEGLLYFIAGGALGAAFMWRRK